MTKKIYRTAQGKMVDLGALQLQNENIRAVGNMGVNARGDIINSNNKSINTRNQQVAKQYRKQTNVSNNSLVKNNNNAVSPEPAPVKKSPETVQPTDVAPDTGSTGGLAAAIARARSIKQEPLEPAPSRNNDGPVKI